MPIESVTVNERQQLVVRIDGSERLLPDGVFRNDVGDMIAVSDGTLSEMVTRDSPAALEALTESLVDQLSQSTTEIDHAVAHVQQILATFNLQYLELQDALQQENRQFTMVSNILKSKSESARSTIDNIR